MAKLLAMLLAFLTIAANAENAKRTNIAVMSLNNYNVSGDEAKALTVRLINEIQNLATFDVLEREQMQGVLKEQGFQQTGACDETSCLMEVGKLLAVEKIIGGSISRVGETFTVQARIIDLQTGRVEKAVSRDYKGGIDVLMTLGMHEVAAEMCGKLSQQNDVKVIIKPEQRYKMESRSPIFGGLMSAVCPGLGQLYAKQYTWAAAFFSGFVLGIALLGAGPNDSTVTSLEEVGAFLLLMSWFGAVIEAPFAVIQYNNQLKEKYGVSLQLNSRRRELGLAFDLTF
jgi:TolB-like protein